MDMFFDSEKEYYLEKNKAKGMYNSHDKIFKEIKISSIEGRYKSQELFKGKNF